MAQPSPNIFLPETQRIHIIDATEGFYQNLEGAFDESRLALEGIKRRMQSGEEEPNGPGGAHIVLSHPMLEQLSLLAAQGEPPPVMESQMGGIWYLESNVQLALRLALYTFKGTRLWDEIIAPYFDKRDFIEFLRFTSEIHSQFVFDVDIPSVHAMTVPTQTGTYSHWIRNLMTQAGIDRGAITDMEDMVDNEIKDQIEKENGLRISEIDENDQERQQLWHEKYKQLWEQRDHELITEGMLAFMQGKILVYFNIDYSTQSQSTPLPEANQLVDWVQQYLSNSPSPSALSPINRALVGVIADQVISLSFSGRTVNSELIEAVIAGVLARKHQRYAFVAVVNTELLQVATKS